MSMIRFEFDPNKSLSNRDEQGIDFEAAQALWADGGLVEVEARSDDEPRFFAIGKIGGKNWTAICVRRGDAIRIISVRRSRKQEIRSHEGG